VFSIPFNLIYKLIIEKIIRMKILSIILLSASVLSASCSASSLSGVDLLRDMFDNCLNDAPFKCINEKARIWVRSVANEDTINITDELALVRTKATEQFDDSDQTERSLPIIERFQKFLSTHALKIKPPQILEVEEFRSRVPEYLLKGGISEGLIVPLSTEAEQGRGFVKKVMIPFLMGLKFKTTVLVPIALALIALKTWKAMTLGLLSLVLSGAMVIFKLAKPKLVNYEVLHYPHHHHLEHHHHLPHVAPHNHHHIPLEPHTHATWA
jgi:hypothetical protein